MYRTLPKDEKVLAAAMIDGEWLITTTNDVYRYDKTEKVLVPIQIKEELDPNKLN